MAASSWRAAKLGEDSGASHGAAFTCRSIRRTTGPLNVLVRATSRNGAQQPATLTPNPSGYHHNMIQSLTLEVA